MGIKDLWQILTPYCDRKPINELRGKTVAIDLAGWVCQSLNAVDYFVDNKHHLKNLYFRACYLIWEEITPIFVLEGTAPKLKSKTIKKRNELQFRGVKPKNIINHTSKQSEHQNKERTKFNHVLRQCEILLNSMGILCLKGPGEAEAYCAFLNKKGLVDGVISQDSDCFAYGAVRVYRHFSVSTRSATKSQGGSVDIYDMDIIRKSIDFGQNKTIAMALLCGCDYRPDGIDGVGRDNVLKFLNKHEEREVLDILRQWRGQSSKYSDLEMRINDKSVCGNCGHIGNKQIHSRKGCGLCCSLRGCDESVWKEKRLAIKAELMLREKALTVPEFPFEDIIEEFLSEPSSIPHLCLTWSQPNIIKFIKQVGPLLHWPEIYCFRKFFPILTRWQVRNVHQITPSMAFVLPICIKKRRTIKGVPSLEVLWKDEHGFFSGLIPDEQLTEFKTNNINGLDDLWVTIEPYSLMKIAYTDIIKSFLVEKELKITHGKKSGKNEKLCSVKDAFAFSGTSLENMQNLYVATQEVDQSVKLAQRRTKKKSLKNCGLQAIDKFVNQKYFNVQEKFEERSNSPMCSTPNTKCISYIDGDDEIEDFQNTSDIVDKIVNEKEKVKLTKLEGRSLFYEPIGIEYYKVNTKKRCLDDLDLISKKNVRTAIDYDRCQSKKCSLDDSFDVLYSNVNLEINFSIDLANNCGKIQSHERLETSKIQYSPLLSSKVKKFCENNEYECSNKNSSFFNPKFIHNYDDFEEIMHLSFGR